MTWGILALRKVAAQNSRVVVKIDPVSNFRGH